MANATVEEYMRAFYFLEKKNGVARSSELAKYMGISKAGVSEMLSSLSARGLLKVKRYSPAELTSKGRTLAKKMTFKHRVLETFLSKKLGFASARVHQEATKLEHASSDEVIERMYLLLGRPKRDPHGQPIRA